MINIDTTVAVIGGLAFFVYGMNLMSDGLQQVAGEKLKDKEEGRLLKSTRERALFGEGPFLGKARRL